MARRGSKAFMNRLVEGCEAPSVWIVNDPDRLGPTILRRMNFALRFPAPSHAVRTKIVDEIAQRAQLDINAGERRRLAALDAAPAVVASAMRTAQLMGARGEVAVDCARATLRALKGEETAEAPQPIPFDLAMARANTDLLALQEKVARAGTLALSFCFHGLPGTGKSAFARHLAHALGLDVIEKRASDLFSKWVGDTEKLIQETFEEAADRRAFLIFDEADSLLASREGATRSWEVSQVNEMLVGMERHPYPFTCTTNAYRSLDAACLRRFLFKVEFLPMEGEQIDAAFKAAFGGPAPRQLLDVIGLTPGDFALVSRKATILGETDRSILERWLMEEVSAKPTARLARIGF
jgi:SpoVK/Ycf46/Vps4 family AAA+-type ATPase